MTTPAFVPQDASTLATVRYYTQFDPYYYSVDNRPLTDLASNITTISSGGGDSARRSVLLTELAVSDVFRHLFTGSTAGYVSGLGVTNPSANTIQVTPGAWYYSDVINTQTTTQILKQALLLSASQFTVTPPATTGQSIDYLVEIQASTLDATGMSSSALPYVDSTNTFLPGLLLNAELKVQIKGGTAAATGSQTAPTVDAGWTPLYIITATNGSSVPIVAFAAGAPAYKHVSKSVDVKYPSSGAATIANVAGVPVSEFADAVTQSIAIPIPLGDGTINPNAPLKFNVVYSADVNTGNSQVQVGYLALGAGGSTTGSATALTAEVLAAPGTANTLASATLTETIPNTAFASFVNNTWQVSADVVYVTLSRLGAGAPDTMAGNLFIHSVTISQ